MLNSIELSFNKIVKPSRKMKVFSYFLSLLQMKEESFHYLSESEEERMNERTKQNRTKINNKKLKKTWNEIEEHGNLISPGN